MSMNAGPLDTVHTALGKAPGRPHASEVTPGKDNPQVHNPAPPHAQTGHPGLTPECTPLAHLLPQDGNPYGDLSCPMATGAWNPPCYNVVHSASLGWVDPLAVLGADDLVPGE
jgi:hypothetical protein